MKNYIKKESEILDEGKRKLIIEEIEGNENIRRKAEAYKKYECFKDLTSRYVVAQLSRQFDQSTVSEMSYAISNISIVRKVINKLAQVYNYGTKREISGNEDETKKLEAAAKILDFDENMKKNNRFLKLQKNTMVYVKPCPVYDGDTERFEIKLEVLSPYLFDVIEDHYNREKPLCVILSNYSKQGGMSYINGDAGSTAAHGVAQSPAGPPSGDGKDQMIADAAADKGAGEPKEYIWWTKNYHFTTDANGQITSSSEDQNSNPIQELPFVSFAIDQDGNFWAEGGSDLVDGAIKINSMISHLDHIGVVQGYGQFYMIGKNLPRQIVMGPSKAILLEQEEGEPDPKLGYADSNPKLAELKSNIEMYIALLLSTNNLSTSSVATALKEGVAFPSGIAMIFDKAESLEDIGEQSKQFVQKEGSVWYLVYKWVTLYGEKKLLAEPYNEIKLTEEVKKVLLTVGKPQAIMSESEKLDAIQKRKDLGINTQLDLIMIDNPGMNKTQAEQKLKEILEEKIKRLQDQVNAGMTPPPPEPNPKMPPEEMMKPADKEDHEPVAQDGHEEE